jgi:ketosteroid isomerase-like protein
MKYNQLPDEIRKVAMDLDNAIENKDIDVILSSFSDDCEIELLGIKLTGKEGARRWINWLYTHLAEIKFFPVTIMVDGNTFFEEFIAKAKLHNDVEIQSNQAEVLIYKNYKIKSLRVYFDRLDFADSVAKGFISKTIVRKLIKASLKGLV